MQGPVSKNDDLDALVGSVVAGKYRIDRVLGRGGMGAVFSATNTTMGKRVALKFLTREAARDKSATQRFQREAEAAGVIESEHIVHVFDSGMTDDGLPFLVMELLAGEDLRTRLQREGMLAVSQAVEIVTQLLRGLVRAHAAGIVHRDLKPDNVFLCRRDDGSTLVKIVDFGISKLSHGRAAKTLTRRGTVLGTAYYMAPEQAQAAEGVDHRADLYGAGTILFEMLAGHPPHLAPTHEAVLVAICTKDAPDVRTVRPDTPAGLARLVERALARDRDARIGSAEEFLEGLAGSPGPAAVARAHTAKHGAASVLVSSTTERRRTGNRRTLVAGVLAALLGFTLTAVLVARGKAPTKNPSVELGTTASAEASALAPPPVPRATVEVAPVTSTPPAEPPRSDSAEPRPSAKASATERRPRSSSKKSPAGTDAGGAGAPPTNTTAAGAPPTNTTAAGAPPKNKTAGRTLTLSTREP